MSSSTSQHRSLGAAASAAGKQTSAAAAAASAAAAKIDLVDEWMIDEVGLVTTKDAKQLYFLATDDLAALPCYKFGGGIGCGPPTKCYKHLHLVEASLDKHGRAGVAKKLEARRKREEKKREKEIEAEAARKRMKTNNDIGNVASSAASSGAGAVTKPAASAPAKDSTEVKKLRASLLKMAKKNLGFERSGAPSNWRFVVPGTSPSTFAALMERPSDTDLQTFVKNGAYYTVERHDVSKLFGAKDAEAMTRKFKREGVLQRIGSTVCVRYKPSAMELSVSGYAEICGAYFGW